MARNERSRPGSHHVRVPVGGHVTPRSAGLLTATMKALRAVGRTRVVRGVRERVAAAGGRLVRHRPEGPLTPPRR